MTRIKVCGVTDIEIAELCTTLGVNFIGLIFSPGRRRVTPDTARSITGYITRMPRRPVVVGWFGDTPTYEVNLLADYCDLDWIQLSGNVPANYAKKLKRPIIRVRYVSEQATPDEIQGYVSKSFGTREVCLFDSGTQGRNGGPAEPFDWSVLSGLSPFIPVLVGGGLSPENVGQLIEGYHPWGIDVSAELERGGKQSQSKIKAFIKAVRDADARLGIDTPF